MTQRNVHKQKHIAAIMERCNPFHWSSDDPPAVVTVVAVPVSPSHSPVIPAGTAQTSPEQEQEQQQDQGLQLPRSPIAAQQQQQQQQQQYNHAWEAPVFQPHSPLLAPQHPHGHGHQPMTNSNSDSNVGFDKSKISTMFHPQPNPLLLSPTLSHSYQYHPHHNPHPPQWIVNNNYSSPKNVVAATAAAAATDVHQHAVPLLSPTSNRTNLDRLFSTSMVHPAGYVHSHQQELLQREQQRLPQHPTGHVYCGNPFDGAAPQSGNPFQHVEGIAFRGRTSKGVDEGDEDASDVSSISLDSRRRYFPEIHPPVPADALHVTYPPQLIVICIRHNTNKGNQLPEWLQDSPHDASEIQMQRFSEPDSDAVSPPPEPPARTARFTLSPPPLWTNASPLPKDLTSQQTQDENRLLRPIPSNGIAVADLRQFLITASWSSSRSTWQQPQQPPNHALLSFKLAKPATLTQTHRGATMDTFLQSSTLTPITTTSTATATASATTDVMVGDRSQQPHQQRRGQHQQQGQQRHHCVPSGTISVSGSLHRGQSSLITTPTRMSMATSTHSNSSSLSMMMVVDSPWVVSSQRTMTSERNLVASMAPPSPLLPSSTSRGHPVKSEFKHMLRRLTLHRSLSAVVLSNHRHHSINNNNNNCFNGSPHHVRHESDLDHHADCTLHASGFLA